MKRFTFVLLVLALCLTGLHGSAQENSDPVIWYQTGYEFDGSDIMVFDPNTACYELKADGSGQMVAGGIEPIELTWTEDEEKITLSNAQGESLILFKEGEHLVMRDETGFMGMIFSRERLNPTDYEPVPAKAEVTMDAFSGLWKGYLLVDGENRVPANALNREINIGLDEGVGIVTWTTLMGCEYAEVIGVVEEADSSDADQTVSVLSLNDASGETLFRFSLLEDGVLVCYDYLGNADLYMSRSMIQVNETVVVSVD